MSHSPSLLEIALYFLVISMLAVGGANVVIPEMHHELVEMRGWLSGDEFVSLVALSQVAPGPNVLIVSLIGWKVAGFAGALTATIAMCVPCALITYCFSRFWQRFRAARWAGVVREGLVPVTIGLILASGYVLAHTADHDWMACALTAATVGLALKTRIHPLWLMLLAALLGMAGFI